MDRIIMAIYALRMTHRNIQVGCWLAASLVIACAADIDAPSFDNAKADSSEGRPYRLVRYVERCTFSGNSGASGASSPYQCNQVAEPAPHSEVLQVANTYSKEALDAFLSSRAAKSIVAVREANGPFTTLAELDDVRYVGTAALNAIAQETLNLVASVGTRPAPDSSTSNHAEILRIANFSSESLLRSIVGSRATRSILEAREEKVIETIQELDALRYIGPATLGRITSAANTNLSGRSKPVLNLEFDALPLLGEDFVYEGWYVKPGAPPASTGRFEVYDDGVVFPERFVIDHPAATSESSALESALFVLTIEPRADVDLAPSSVHILGGAFRSGAGTHLVGDISHATAIGDDFTGARGSFILATPSSADTRDNDQGIWFLNPAEGTPSLNLPALPAGWAYEGWAVDDDGPVSLGRFNTARGADSDGAGPAAGPEATPPFPGQDFISPARSLVGNTIVISVEPSPDDSPAPFALKPLLGTASDALAPTLQSLRHNDATLPSVVGTVHLR